MSRISRYPSREPRLVTGMEYHPAFARGLRSLQNRRFAEAVDHLKGALESKPSDVSALSNLGLALGALGRFDEALAALDGAIAGRPDSHEFHYNRANILRLAGRSSEAIRAYDCAVALKPAFPEAWANRGAALQEIGREAEALASYERALAINPGLVEALFNKAALLDAQGRALDAIAAYDKALTLDPRNAQGRVMRGQLLGRLGRAEQALQDFREAARVDPGNAAAGLLGGDQLVALGRSEEALQLFQAAVEAEPGNAEAHDRLGLCFVDIGRIEDARRAHERAVQLSPQKAAFYYNLIAVAKLGADDPKFLAMNKLAEDIKSLSYEEAVPLRFALAKGFTDQGRPELAFDHLRKGNALKRARIVYDERAALADMKTIQSLYRASVFAEHRGHGDPDPAPVFVLGMPRSGSTLIEQILASHPQVHGAGEITDFIAAAVAVAGENLRDLHSQNGDANAFRDKLRRIGADYIGRIRARDPKAGRIVNKMPDNFRFVGLIHLALPNARIIHTKRNSAHTCLSCYSHLFSGDVPYAFDLAELGRYYRAYDALMAHWRAVVAENALLDVHYEDLVADPETQARRIVAHCSLDWDGRCLDFHRTVRPVRTASAVQVRRPIYADAAARWRQFDAELAPLIAALGPSAPQGAVRAKPLGGVLGWLRSMGVRFGASALCRRGRGGGGEQAVAYKAE